MLLFFRKLRKSFIRIGLARKYLIYAIGEIVLVVMGILIALQINNWNEYKKIRIKEKKVLEQISRPIETNSDHLSSAISDMMRFRERTQEVISIVQEKRP